MFSSLTPAKKFRYIAIASLVCMFTVLIFIISASAGGDWTHMSSKVKNSPQKLSVKGEFGLTEFVQKKSNGQTIKETYEKFRNAIKEVNPDNSVISVLDDIISAGKTTTAMLVLTCISVILAMLFTVFMYPLDKYPKTRILAPVLSGFTTFWAFLAFVVWDQNGHSRIDNFVRLALSNHSTASTSREWCYGFTAASFVFMSIATILTVLMFRMKKEQYTDEVNEEEFLEQGDYDPYSQL